MARRKRRKSPAADDSDAPPAVLQSNRTAAATTRAERAERRANDKQRAGISDGEVGTSRKKSPRRGGGVAAVTPSSKPGRSRQKKKKRSTPRDSPAGGARPLEQASRSPLQLQQNVANDAVSTMTSNDSGGSREAEEELEHENSTATAISSPRSSPLQQQQQNSSPPSSPARAAAITPRSHSIAVGRGDGGGGRGEEAVRGRGSSEERTPPEQMRESRISGFVPVRETPGRDTYFILLSHPRNSFSTQHRPRRRSLSRLARRPVKAVVVATKKKQAAPHRHGIPPRPRAPSPVGRRVVVPAEHAAAVAASSRISSPSPLPRAPPRAARIRRHIHGPSTLPKGPCAKRPTPPQ